MELARARVPDHRHGQAPFFILHTETARRFSHRTPCIVMVVLAASICTRAGTPILSRQFRDMSRSRVELLLASFPRLVSAHAQHTTIDADTVRYVYTPLEDLYLVLITNRTSNILQDIDTLHLFARVVQDMCANSSFVPPMVGEYAYPVRAAAGRVDETSVLRLSFELLGAFDEIIALGYRESVTLPQIQTILAMESHEEKIQEMIERNKEAEAKEELKRRAKMLENQRRDAARRGIPSSNFAASIGASAPGGFAGNASPSLSSPTVHRDDLRAASSPAPSAPSKAFKGKGMQLGKKSSAATANFLDPVATATPSTISPAPTPAASSEAPATAPAPGGAAPATSTPVEPVPSAPALDPHVLLPAVDAPVKLLARERVSLAAERDGSVRSLDVRGDLELTVRDAHWSKIRVSLAANASPLAGSLAWKTHPHIDAGGWATNTQLSLRDPKRAFPLNHPLGVLRWRATLAQGSADLGEVAPLVISSWPGPAPSGDGAEAIIEFSAAASLHNVTIRVALPGSVGAQVTGATQGDPDVQSNFVAWRLGDLDAGASGTLELTVPGADAEDPTAFATSAEFWSATTLALINVQSVTATESGDPAPFALQSFASPDRYVFG